MAHWDLKLRYLSNQASNKNGKYIENMAPDPIFPEAEINPL
jgi:hypothetical protein